MTAKSAMASASKSDVGHSPTNISGDSFIARIAEEWLEFLSDSKSTMTE